MKRVEVPTYTATIYVGGDPEHARVAARQYCDVVGLCVTVTETSYHYTNGETKGVAVGLINYGRFPSTPEMIFAHAEDLAVELIEACHQESASIVAGDRTVWLSKRPEDPPRAL